MADGLVVLVVGGYGTFGGRLVQLLENEARLTLIVAGRSLDQAKRFCQARGEAKARLVPAVFDRDGALSVPLAAHRPDIVVDASGPFQAYGAAPYRLVQACLDRGVNYLDLADGSAFVAGIGAFDAAARETGLYLLSGVSSFPVLTAAVVRRLASDLASIEAIQGGIAPSPYAGVGRNVIRALAGYAGQPIALKDHGKFGIGYPFTETRRFTIAPPGLLPLPSTLFSLVDVPDLQALAALRPEAKRVWMGAGPVPELLHRALIGFAWLVRLRLLPSLSWLAPLMAFVTNNLRWGGHRGGMFVEIDGIDRSGAPVKRTWHLLAEGDDGPLIPSMAVEALIRKALDLHPPPPGARAAMRDLELDDYERLFAHRTIRAGIRGDVSAEAAPLYARILGQAWDELPTEIRAIHDIDRSAAAAGRASVERGPGWAAGLVAALMGFPPSAADTPVRVKFDASNGTETWTRTFGETVFSSEQAAGTDRSTGLICERFGTLVFAMALVLDGQRLRLILRRWSVFGLALPMALCPRSDAYEAVEAGRFRFHVEISHPLIGLIVRYRGWLIREDKPV